MPGSKDAVGARDDAATGARELSRGGATSLWTQLLDDLYRRLAVGEFAGSFPGELELAADYRVSRHTVREALRRLRAEGVVTAERGRAPRLAERAAITQPLGALYSLFAAVEAAGLEQTSVVRALDVRADGVFAARLGLEEATPLLYLERLRLAGGTPLALDRVWLPASVAAPLAEVDFSHTGLYDELASRTGTRLSGGHEQVRAVVPSRIDRELLGITAGVAAFAIDRLGCASGEPVEWRHTVVRGDRFHLTVESCAATGYRLALAGRTSHSTPLIHQ